MTNDAPLPKFNRPPVNEVAIGVQFPPLKALQAIHLGGYWQQIKKDYPHVEEHIPIAHVIEQREMFATQSAEEQQSFVIPSQPPIPRMWFLDADRRQLIQVQSDRFLRNWRQQEDSQPYPSFTALFGSFLEAWTGFGNYLTAEGLGTTDINQCELTYINHLPAGRGWNSTKDLGRVFRFASSNGVYSFLPEPGAVGWRAHYPLPNESGRLHVVLKQGIRNRDKSPIFSFELTARGAPAAADTLEHWFEVAHEWVVRGFTDLTTPEMHKLWERVA